LTVTGEAQSPYCSNDVAAAATYVRVFAGEKPARSAFAKEAQRGLVRCLASSVSDQGNDQLVAEPAGTLRIPHAGDRGRAFRIVVAAPGQNLRSYLDVVFVQRRRVLTLAIFYGAGAPAALEADLIARLPARA